MDETKNSKIRNMIKYSRKLIFGCISLYNKGFVWFPRRCLSRMIACHLIYLRPCAPAQVSLAHSRNEEGTIDSFSAHIGLNKSIDI